MGRIKIEDKIIIFSSYRMLEERKAKKEHVDKPAEILKEDKEEIIKPLANRSGV